MKKMVMAVIYRQQAEQVLDVLIKAGFSATFIECRGGMLRQSQYALYIAVDAQDLLKVLEIIKLNCHKEIQAVLKETAGPADQLQITTAQIGGAAIFVWDLDNFEIY